MPTRAETRRVLMILLAAVLVALAGLWGQRRQAEAETERGFPEPVREVVEPRPEAITADSILCVETELTRSGILCGTIREPIR